MKKKSALITGIAGQDGSYLAELLLGKGYRVFGLARYNSISWRNIEHILDRIELISGGFFDQTSLVSSLKKIKPDEVYNLAAQSFVHESWKQPVYTGETTGLGAIRLLEAIRSANPKIKFYQASTSEMFGAAIGPKQNEKTPFNPRSPYGIAKLYAHWMVVNYREAYKMFAVSGILFNHESPRRGQEFVTRKITQTAAKIKLGLADELRLGDLSAKRDWGFAGDYVKAMWLMLQQKTPRDYVIGTGENHSVREFVELSFKILGLDWKKYVKIDEQFKRPADVGCLRADSSLAKRELKWRPKVKFKDLVKMMVEADLARLRGTNNKQAKI